MVFRLGRGVGGHLCTEWWPWADSLEKARVSTVSIACVSTRVRPSHAGLGDAFGQLAEVWGGRSDRPLAAPGRLQIDAVIQGRRLDRVKTGQIDGLAPDTLFCAPGEISPSLGACVARTVC